MEKFHRSPVEIGSFSHGLRRVSYMSCQFSRRISEPSTLWSCGNPGNFHFETEVIFASQKGRAGECIWNLGSHGGVVWEGICAGFFEASLFFGGGRSKRGAKKTTWVVYATHWNFEESRWCFEMCLIFSPRSLGMMIQFDEHFFQLGGSRPPNSNWWMQPKTGGEGFVT